MSTTLPRSVVSFVSAHVDHVIKLRFLVTLHGAPCGTVSVTTIARTLDIPKNQVRDMANELVEDGLVRSARDQLELAPTSIEDRLAIADLASAYSHDRDVVLELLRSMGRAAS